MPKMIQKLNFLGTPTKPKKENAPPVTTPASTRRLRRRSKSAANILDPTKSVASRIKTTLNNFRTPQPIRRTKSKLPVRKYIYFSSDFPRKSQFLQSFDRNFSAQTEKPTRKAKPLAPVVENEQEKLLLGMRIQFYT